MTIVKRGNEASMKKKLLQSIGLIFSLSLFAAALLIIHYELKEYRLKDVLYHLDKIPAVSLCLAILLTILNYAVLTGYDALAFRYIHHPLQDRKSVV